MLSDFQSIQSATCSSISSPHRSHTKRDPLVDSIHLRQWFGLTPFPERQLPRTRKFHLRQRPSSPAHFTSNSALASRRRSLESRHKSRRGVQLPPIHSWVRSSLISAPPPGWEPVLIAPPAWPSTRKGISG